MCARVDQQRPSQQARLVIKCGTFGSAFRPTSFLKVLNSHGTQLFSPTFYLFDVSGGGGIIIADVVRKSATKSPRNLMRRVLLLQLGL